MNYSKQCTGYYTSNTDPLKKPWSTRIHVLPRASLNLRQPLKWFSSHCYSDFSVQYHFKGAEWLGDFRRGRAGNMRKIQHVITTLQWVYMPLNWPHSKHPKLHLCVSSSLCRWVPTFSHQSTRIGGGWPGSYLPSEGCSKPHIRPQSAAVAAAKISTEGLEKTPRQDPEADLGLDHFTLKIMCFSKGSPSRGGTLTVMVSHPVLPWFICAFAGRNVLQRQDIHYSTTRNPHYLPSPQPSQRRGPEIRAQRGWCVS